jgi:site-specific recombinase XerD
LQWVKPLEPELARITPGLVGKYFDSHPGSIPSKKLHLAALRAFFDCLARRHIVLFNPAASVRGERYEAVEGKTPEITVEQVRMLLKSIDTTTLIGKRDKSIIAILVYTAARAGAVANLRIKDFEFDGTQYALRFESEKGGKSREIPCRDDLRKIIASYFDAAMLQFAPKDWPLFRSASGRQDRLTASAITGGDICRMVKRRLHDAGLPSRLSPHSFRVATVTDLLEQNVPLEDVQFLAGHSDVRTTRLYDRRRRKVSRNIVERISV